MINWEDFDHIHVIKKLKEILSSWWQVELLFTDDQGVVRAFSPEKATLQNKAVSQLMKRENAENNLSELVKKTLHDLRQTGNHFAIRTWDMSGYDVAVFPILINNDLMGAVVALGFIKDDIQKDRLKQVRERFAGFGWPEDQIEEALSQVHIFEDAHREHFTDLAQLAAQEIVSLHVEISAKEERISELNSELGSRYKYSNMIGKSRPMQDLYSMLDKIKNTEATILVQGENGTGKELIAKAIHYNSTRKNKPFIIQNCSAFNDNLLESELFGHIKGAFTGAIRDKKGLFELAHRGTFFLDEIGDTSPTMQVKLLRVLQEGTFLPVGGTEPRKVDVRIIAATNQNLKEMVEKGTFREDLYYRLNVIHLLVPPLRKRKEDIPLLVEHFLTQSFEKLGMRHTIAKKALEKLYDYLWPGNIRELQNEIERLVVLAGEESKITQEMLSARILNATDKAAQAPGISLHGKLKDTLESVEREVIQEGLRRTGWNKSRLAKELGISRAGLIMKVEKYNLDRRKASMRSFVPPPKLAS